MRLRIGVALPLLVVLSSGCGRCTGEADPWELDEVVEEAAHEETPAPARSVCDANRRHVRDLGIVDEATLARVVPGEVMEIHVDYGADGVLEGCWLSMFDESGDEVVDLVDHDMVAGPQRIYWHMDYDARSGKPTRTLGDQDGDGAWDYEGTAAFDELGNYRWSTVDEGADGSVDVRAYFFYDDRGQRTRQERDQGDDGVIDGFDDFVVDDAGRIVQWDADFDADGAWDRQMTWTFGATQNSFTQVDFTETGTLREHFVMELDEQGRVVRTTADRDGDGVIDDESWVEWDGLVATTTYDFDGDGAADNIERHEWHSTDSSGLILDDYDADGSWDAIRRHTYDEEDRLLHFEQLDPMTQRVTFRQTYVRGAD